MPGPFTGNPFSGRFGSFLAAVNDPEVRATPGGVQMYVWQDLKNYYIARGDPLPAGAFGYVNDLLSLAGQQRRAQASLGAAKMTLETTGLDQAITANHTSPSLDTRAVSDMISGPQHRMVYMTQELVDGESVLSYRTHDFGYDLPQSVSALNDVADAAAQVSAADYGYEWGGVATPVAILSY